MNPRGLFTELGDRIAQRWRKIARDEVVFPELAADALAESALHQRISLDELGAALMNPDWLPMQNNLGEGFGEPPIAVYRGEGFFVEVIFWLEGLVSIHHHSFGGAFQVFHGSSIHCRYNFFETRRINAGFRFGSIELAGAELLEAGDCRMIQSGQSFIHTTFHLDRPTISLVVRIEQEAEMGPQLDYRRPSLAFRIADQGDRSLWKALQVLRTLLRADHQLYRPQIERLLKSADLPATYYALDQAFECLKDGRDRLRLIELARDRHGSDIDALLEVLDESDRRRRLAILRHHTRDPELRFFLALLLNVPHPGAIVELLHRRHPQARIGDWLARFAGEDAKLLGALPIVKRLVAAM